MHVIEERIIHYEKKKKDSSTYYFACMRFKFSPIIAILFVSALLSIYFIIVSILEKTTEPIILAISSIGLFILAFLVLFVATIRFKRTISITFHGHDSIFIELKYCSEQFTLINKTTENKFLFHLKEIKRIGCYKKAIVLETESRVIVTFPNIPEIKTLFDQQ